MARHMRTTFDQRVEKIGLTGAKWRVIAVVLHCPGTTQRNIASLLDVTEVTAGRLVDRLCESGYLERRADPDDRRAYRVYLTKAARPLLKQLKQIAMLSEREALAGMSDEDLKRFESYMDIVAQNVSRKRGGKDARTGRASTK
jgi:MarR family transcriptional regulator for hemolysin